ncbi:Lysyl-tRNA_synthetase [Hexamita inflata]|uniref:lysine--tRNA ligase n=1 Tax=Hexamita inflata TaxID=28002 RepID=A0AA86P577_9EUKA|nr:Lysyl-tRNA synthetase [Hexamita inflata]
MSEPAAAENKLLLDEVTGEMVSKNELKRRQKQRQKDAEKVIKTAAAKENGIELIDAESTSKLYFDTRKKEVAELQAKNQSPYTYKVHITTSVKEFKSQYEPLKLENGEADLTKVESLSGRVMSIRRSGQSLVFLVIEEGAQAIQVFCSSDVCAAQLGQTLTVSNPAKPNLNTLTEENLKKASNYEALNGKTFDWFKTLDNIKRGDIINVTGCPMRTKTGELSIQPTQLILTAPCFHMLPKANQSVTDIEFRYMNRSVDLFFNKKSQTLLKRIKLVQFIKDFFINKYDFLEVETPILHQIKGGANAKPFITYYNDLQQNVFLRIAPELYLKQLVIGGLNRVFEMNRNFRNESIDNTHLPEFTMLEAYCAYWDLYDQIAFVEDLMSSCVKYCNVTFNGQVDSSDNPDLYLIKYKDWNGNDYNIDFRPPFKKLDIMSSLQEILSEKLGEEVLFPRPYSSDEMNQYLQDLVFKRLHVKKIIKKEDLPTAPFTTSRLIDYLVGIFLEKLTHNPMFLLHHPKIMSPLAKPHRDDTEITERFEIFCAMFELCNAYTELNDSVIQRENFESQQKDKAQGDDEAQDVDEVFLRAMEHGMVQQSGLGVGIDRFMMLLCGEQSIRECIAFPLLREKK